MDEEDDLFFELGVVKRRKKGVNSGRKGKRGERDLAKIFTARFPTREGFSRVVGSGSHGHRAGTTEAKNVLSSDLVTPPKFRFSIESKYGYDEVDLFVALGDGVKTLDNFLTQAEDDAKRVGKKPLLCWKRPRLHWLCFTREELPAWDYSMNYRGWKVVTLDRLLSLNDSFFFEDGDGKKEGGQGHQGID